MLFNFSDHPHRRFNPLNGQWVLVSPHRTKRPWLGKKEAPSLDTRPEYDPGCYLCPGNRRAAGEINPQYASTFIFQNDFSALLEETPAPGPALSPLTVVAPAGGTCRVICFSPKHNLTLPLMSLEAIAAVIDVWVAQAVELGARYRWVQIFENKGDIMGCSNPHPHGQIWASDFLPQELSVEDARQRLYHEERRAIMLLDYLEGELREGERVVVENEHWAALVPFWALWPYEILLVPRRHVPRLDACTAAERQGLASILKRLLTRYDNLFSAPFPYSFGWHGAPGGEEMPYWQLHGHFYPPLLRSSTVKKYMVGYELLAEAQRDITPEQAAGQLRKLSEIHYTTDSKG